MNIFSGAKIKCTFKFGDTDISQLMWFCLPTKIDSGNIFLLLPLK